MGPFMKIGIIVYSQTGNTFSVAQKLKDKLAAAGHSVNIERLTPVGDVQKDTKNIRFEKLPDLTGYDALVFAGPVQAFSLAPVMKMYMNQLPSLNNKKAVVFITKGLALAFTGGNQAIKTLTKSVESKGGTVVGTGMVFWGSKDRENQINDVVSKLSSSL
jgi:NAD(P)H dehydrogenase (quinone)